MSDLLSIGASGVRAYQTALATVGENIANTGVAGYSRRTVTLNEVAAAQGTVTSKAAAGNGVVVGGIKRATDAYATAAVRSATADLARTQGTSTLLTQIQSALTDNDLTARMTSFFTAASGLAAEPSSTALRANMLGAATSAAAAFTATGDAFTDIETNLDTSGTNAAQSLTSLGTALARVNDGLGRTQTGTAAAAQLADQRDQILDSMSALTSIDARTDAIGRATVKLGNATGPTLVSMVDAGSVAYQRNDDGTVAFTASFGGTTDVVSPDGGALAGLIDGSQKITAARAGVEAMASDFTTSMNAVQAQGDDLNGQAGQPLFATGARATDITVALADGTGIAAAARGGNVRDGTNLAALQSVRTGQGFEASATALITDTATAIKQKATIADAQTAIHDGATTTLANSAGVSLDSEAVDLIRFQQAYSATSRVIQVARDTFQTILEIR